MRQTQDIVHEEVIPEKFLEQILLMLKNAESADKLYISEHTVGNHLKSIYEKMWVRNRNSLLQKKGTGYFLKELTFGRTVCAFLLIKSSLSPFSQGHQNRSSLWDTLSSVNPNLAAISFFSFPSSLNLNISAVCFPFSLFLSAIAFM